jgi:hypothetical protein
MSSGMLIGNAPGSFISGFIADVIGPKLTLFGAGIIIILSSVGLVIQSHYIALIILRIFGGIGVGALNSLGPSYSAGFGLLSFFLSVCFCLDLSSSDIRGRIVSLHWSSACFGILISYALNIPFNFVLNGWRYEFGLTSLVPLFLVIISLIIPEGNVFMKKKQKKNEEREYFKLKDFKKTSSQEIYVQSEDEKQKMNCESDKNKNFENNGMECICLEKEKVHSEDNDCECNNNNNDNNNNNNNNNNSIVNNNDNNNNINSIVNNNNNNNNNNNDGDENMEKESKENISSKIINLLKVFFFYYFMKYSNIIYYI